MHPRLKVAVGRSSQIHALRARHVASVQNRPSGFKISGGQVDAKFSGGKCQHSKLGAFKISDGQTNSKISGGQAVANWKLFSFFYTASGG
jgi:hypothetical protein